MTGAIFINTLKIRFRSTLYWGLGIGFLSLFIVAVIPDQATLDQYARLVEMMPPVVLQMLGTEEVSALTTADGFVAFGAFNYSLLILAGYAVMAGLGITSSDEDDGIMDILLSLPVKRWQVIVEKFVAIAVLTIMIVAMMYGGIVIGTLFTELEFNLGALAQAALNMIPALYLMIAVTALIASIFANKTIATAIATAFIIGSYFLNFLATAASDSFLGELKMLSVFSYANAQTVLDSGLQWPLILLVVVVVLLVIATATIFFERRDVGA